MPPCGSIAREQRVRRVSAGSSIRATWLAPTLAAASLSLAACSHLHWPWHHKQPAPEVAHELAITTPAGAPTTAYPQYWQRNTVVLDLQAISGSGEIELTPRPNHTWPVRIALHVRPGSVGQLEAQADQRIIIPVTASGSKPVDLELPPGLYSATTMQMSVRWGPAVTP
jgi:hypothetical protein